MLSSLLCLVAMPAGNSPAVGIPAFADVPAVDSSRAVADGSVAAAGVPPLLLPLLLPKPLYMLIFTVMTSLLLVKYLLFLTPLMMLLCS